MPTNMVATPTRMRCRVLGLAWVAMLLMSRLPQIVRKECFGIETAFVWLWLGA